MCSVMTKIKGYISRVISALRPVDIACLKMCCVSFGVLLTGLFPGLAKGRRKLFWAALYCATLAPLLVVMGRSISPNKKLGQ